MVISPAATPAPTLVGRPARPSRDRMEDEIRRLNQRVRELELELISKELKDEVSRGGFPSPLPTPAAAPSSAFQENWQARTDARVKLLCSLNRAGNALCAWHDSRRERRAYPPRMAPPGYLNCGCTFDEALFEESLARHGVGSYLPGESVRMDPALRNPLLKLLQQRYHYRDGDFEREPVTGNWIEGEGASFWEGKVTAGVSYSRKYRGEERRS
ncbi:hypothetical protein A0H81_02438 [Grifola frondosa]|uniref:Uncharacterized protein n=1 Tax=Grifola frondosa TaxID=5627 RepID=A0A1C7MNF8_GRIFR|nr:hypothetical protein A0H81_02438 [Grifola frondosa]